MDPSDLVRSDIDPERNQNADSSHEDTESYGPKRARGLAKIEIFNFVLLVVSLGGMASGLASLFIVGQVYAFPMAFPVGAGGSLQCVWLPGLLAALFGICGVRRAKVQPHGDMKDCCFKCLFAMWMFLLDVSLLLSMIGFGMSGVWSIIECSTIEPADSSSHSGESFRCLNSKKEKHLAAAYANAVICGVLFAVTVVGNVFWCCYHHSFGFHRYEEIDEHRVTCDARVGELESELQALRSQQASESQLDDPRYHGDRRPRNEPGSNRVNDDELPPSYKEAIHAES